jgi:hypothetical protein
MFSTQSEPADASPIRPWPADQVERWAIERLIPCATNPRLPTEADLGKIVASILKWGWTMPVLVGFELIRLEADQTEIEIGEVERLQFVA